MREIDGWYLIRMKETHRQYRHAGKKGVLTLAGKPSDELSAGAINSIFRQAGLKDEISDRD